MNNQTNKKAAQVFARALAATLAASMTEAVGSPLLLKVVDGHDLSERHGQPVHFRLSSEGALSGECFIEFYEPQISELGSKIPGQSATEAGTEPGDKLLTLISSAMAGLAANLSAEYGELTLKVERVADLAFGGMLVVPLAASMGAEFSMPVLLYFDPVFLAALSSSSAMKPAEVAATQLIDPVNLKLVMDVELNVSLRFGQRELPLREVLELASGSVVELDRHVDEPVELLLDGKVIARGEAVIVDGNYGLRVTEIPQPIEPYISRWSNKGAA